MISVHDVMQLQGAGTSVAMCPITTSGTSKLM